MANFNKVMLVGNLTRDPELKHTPSNQAVAQIGLAVNRNYQTKDGEKREETTFVDCEAWGRTAEVMSQYLAKGRPVLVEGRLKLDQWQDKDGNNRSKLKVVIENFQFLGGRGEGGQGGGGGGGQSNYASSGNSGSSNQGGGGGGGGGRPSDDPIPF
jgi:single-strand DNA-binding protein